MDYSDRIGASHAHMKEITDGFTVKMPIPRAERPPHEEGFPVLKLPKRGEDLLEGRQYELTPLARAYIDEQLGLVLPRIVECIHKRRPAMRYATHSLNHETGETKWSVLEEPTQEATFRAFMSKDRIHRFTLDLAWLAKREHEAKDSHKVSDYEDKDFKSLSRNQQDKVLGIKRAPKERAPKAVAQIDVLTLLNL